MVVERKIDWCKPVASIRAARSSSFVILTLPRGHGDYAFTQPSSRERTLAECAGIKPSKVRQVLTIFHLANKQLALHIDNLKVLSTITLKNDIGTDQILRSSWSYKKIVTFNHITAHIVGCGSHSYIWKILSQGINVIRHEISLTFTEVCRLMSWIHTNAYCILNQPDNLQFSVHESTSDGFIIMISHRGRWWGRNTSWMHRFLKWPSNRREKDGVLPLVRECWNIAEHAC